MTKQGKYNFLSLLALPAAAVLAAWIAKLNGVWDAYLQTYLFVFGLNLVAVMLIPVVLCGLLLLWSGGTVSRWLAVAPAVLTAAVGALWYLFRAIVPDPVAPGVGSTRDRGLWCGWRPSPSGGQEFGRKYGTA